MINPANSMSFQIESVMDYKRDELQPPPRPWWRKLFWNGDDGEIPTYNYTVTVLASTRVPMVGDGIMMTYQTLRGNESILLRLIDAKYGAYRLTTTIPTADWLISSDFKNATYAVIGRGYTERG